MLNGTHRHRSSTIPQYNTTNMGFLNAAPLTFTTKQQAQSCSIVPNRLNRRISTARIRAKIASDIASSTSWPDVQELSRSGDLSKTALDINGVMELLPHRYPFLLVDRVLALEKGVRAIGVKNVSANEPYFPGHFPGRPIMPGVLQVEALAQLAGVIMLGDAEPDQEFFFGGVDGVRWRRPVLPGDTLVMEAVLKSYKKRFGIVKMDARAFVNGQLTVEGALTLAMVVDKN